MADVALFESKDGGEFILEGNDLLLTDAIFNQIYMALFGGNVEAVTAETDDTGSFNEDWWGNNLLFPDEPTSQFNSRFEKALNEIPLTSGGIIQLESIAKSDLAFLREVATIDISIVLEDYNRARINILVQEPENNESRILVLLWDATKKELITNLNEKLTAKQTEWILQSGSWDDSGFWDDNAAWVD